MSQQTLYFRTKQNVLRAGERKEMALTKNGLSSFGALLKVFRKRRRLTQQQLAEMVGVHRNALIRWEQGDCLPESKTMVLELARHLHLNDQESRQLLEASLTALVPHWLVPLPRNPFFTGREEVLEALHTQLGINQAIALTQSSAVHGLGGVGKTQVALEYAYRYALEYGAVFWIGAETEEQIVFSLLHIADVLQLPEQDDKDQQRVVAAVQRWLATHGQWLLIWDNVEDLTLLNRFLPSARSGAILITTRSQVLGTLARGLDLLPMEQEEGMLFLLRRAKVLAPDATNAQMHQLATCMPAQYAAAQELVKAVGGLPLALDQAGAYLEATQCGLPAYLELFHTQRAALLRQRGEESRNHPESVSTTFALAIAATGQRHPAVWALLRVCAFLQPDAIPEELFLQGSERLGTELEAVCRDELEWNRVVAIACSYSLLSRQPEKQTFSMHRLVQAVLLDTMTEAERQTWTRRVIEALDSVFPEVLLATEYDAWMQGERLLSHALLCLQQAGTADRSLALASLAYKVAQYLRQHGKYTEAESFYLRALHIREQILGPDHPDVARVLNYLAVLYWSQGKYAEAEPLHQRALHIREHALGPMHLDVASSLHNLALLYWSQGKYAEAESLYLRASPIFKQALGESHPIVAQALNNLALLYRDQGKYAEAEPLYQQTLYIQEQTLGPDHLDVAFPLNNLAELSLELGKYAEAERLFRRALHIWGQQLGPEHPLIPHALNGLAIIAREQGKYAEAESLFQQALRIREQHLGLQHPETAETLHDLALLRQKQGNLNEAISFAERAWKARSQSLGDAHPKTAATRALYDQLLQEQA
jgi:tetratricopeptide (TPR) repeat protein/transcriptional regulator with XRE-family HTH domain